MTKNIFVYKISLQLFYNDTVIQVQTQHIQI